MIKMYKGIGSKQYFYNMEYWLKDQPRNDREFRNEFFFVFAEILVVFQLV